MDLEAALRYAEKHRIKDLFRSLTLGLIHNQPDDVLTYMLQCLDKAERVGPNELYLDAFLPKSAQGPLLARLDVVPLEILKANNSKASRQKENGTESKLPPLNKATGRNKVTAEKQSVVKKSTLSNGSIPKQTIPPTPKERIKKEGSNITLPHIKGAVQKSEAIRVRKTPGSDGIRKNKKPDGLISINVKEKAKGPSVRRSNGSLKGGKKELVKKQSTLSSHSSILTSRDSQDSFGAMDLAGLMPFEDYDFDFNLETREQATDELNGEEEEILTTDVIRPCPDIYRMFVDDLPPMPSNVVRIFISSTFSDFKAERNILHKVAFPALQIYCGDLGLDFQAVDMRWGVTDDVINDHLVSELCQDEINNCLKLSRGPNFVAMVGNRYGFQPFPAKIGVPEFECLIGICKDVNPANAQLLQKWFIKDDNMEPSVYLLQPIDTYLPFYNVTSKEKDEERERDHEIWGNIAKELRQALRQAATYSRKLGIMSEEEEKKYYVSATEEEISHGIPAEQTTQQRTFCSIRQLLGIEMDINNPNSSKFIDLDEEQIDEFAKEQRERLVDEHLVQRIHEDKIKRYDVPWNGTPLHESDDIAHLEYLQTFCTDFISQFKTMTESLLSNGSNEQNLDELFLEILHHQKFARIKTQTFCGREVDLQAIRGHLSSSERHSPFFISATSGMGKTSLMAQLAKNIPLWFSDIEVVTILRFMGISPLSSDIRSLLGNVIDQIQHISAMKLPTGETLQNMGTSRRVFRYTLETISRKCQKTKFILILDSVDQLQEIYGAYEMQWLPRDLPENVFIILSVLSSNKTCMETVENRFPCAAVWDLSPLPSEVCVQIKDIYLQMQKRKLTAEQIHFINESFSSCPEPLFLKLLLDYSRIWHSYTAIDEIQISRSVKEVITQLFQRLEERYGDIFISHALGYITYSKGGISSVELEDILSLDDLVLGEVYQYHDPPLEGTIRIPSLLVSRLQHELYEYLVERRVDGKTVMVWYHQQFQQTAEMRYCGNKKSIHSLLADMYLQEDGVKRSLALLHRDKVWENADRRIVPQLLHEKNTRKINCLTFHLEQAERFAELKSHCLLDYNFLLCWLRAFGVQVVNMKYADIAASETFAFDNEIKVCREFIQLNFDSLWREPLLLPYLVQETFPKDNKNSDLLTKLSQDANNWLQTTTHPLLLPTHSIKLPSLEGPLRFTMMVGHNGVLSLDESMLLCQWREQLTGKCRLQAICLKSKEVLLSTSVAKDSPVSIVSPHNKCFISCDGKYLKKQELATGEVLSKILFNEVQYEKYTVRAITTSGKGTYAALAVRFGRPETLKETERWRSECFVYVLDLISNELLASLPFPSKKTC